MKWNRVSMMGLVAALAGQAACGGGADSNELPLDQLVFRRAEVTCAKFFDCCTPPEQVEAMAMFYVDCTTEECCVAAFESFFDIGFIERYQASVDRGRVDFSNDAVATCLTQLEAQSCSDYGGAAIACPNLFTPLQGDGAPCAEWYECQTSYCEGADASTHTDGTCKAKPGLGEACPESICSAGLRCDDSQTVASCVALKDLDEACANDLECSSRACSSELKCTPKSWCDGV